MCDWIKISSFHLLCVLNNCYQSIERSIQNVVNNKVFDVNFHGLLSKWCSWQPRYQPGDNISQWLLFWSLFCHTVPHCILSIGNYYFTWNWNWLGESWILDPRCRQCVRSSLPLNVWSHWSWYHWPDTHTSCWGSHRSCGQHQTWQCLHLPRSPGHHHTLGWVLLEKLKCLFQSLSISPGSENQRVLWTLSIGNIWSWNKRRHFCRAWLREKHYKIHWINESNSKFLAYWWHGWSVWAAQCSILCQQLSLQWCCSHSQ